MTQTDSTWAKIGARFTKSDISPSRVACMIVDRRTSNPIVRLPLPDTDRFKLFIGERQNSLDDLRRHGP
jgi:hypothetical protein